MNSSKSRSSSMARLLTDWCLFSLTVLCVGAAGIKMHQMDIPGIPVGINIDPTNPAGAPNTTALLNLGASWVRVEYKDLATSPANPGALGFYTNTLSTYSAAGLQVILILDYSSMVNVPWGGDSSQWQSYAEIFATRCSVVAANLSNYVVAYEIWNEPDLSQTHVPAASYGHLLRKAYNSIKGVSESAIVVVGGLASGNPAYLQHTAASTGGILYADQVGLHPYGQRPFPNWPNPTWGFGTLANLVASYQPYLQGKPIFVTEVGTNDASVQGEFPWMIFSSAEDVSLQNVTVISTVLWFCWSDGMVNGFGLVTAEQAPKASYFSFVNYTHPPS